MKLFSLFKRHVLPQRSRVDEKSTACEQQNRDRRPRPLRSQSSVRQVVTNTLLFSLSLVEKIGECAPVPGLRGAAGALLVITQRIDDSEQNSYDFAELVSAIDALNNLLSIFEHTAVTGRGLTDDLGEQLFVLSRELGAIKEQIKTIRSHSRLRRMIEANHDAQIIVRGFRRLQSYVNEIMVGSALKAEVRLADLWALEHLDKLPRAKDARYDYVNRPLCSEGTREGVLQEIMKWVKDNNGHQIYWLNGGAGTGKTTIALTVADMLSKDSTIFSASFFCSHESESRSDARLIFPTFAYLFARCDIQVRNRIVRVLEESPDVGHALPAEQLMKLLIEPLRKVYTGTQRPIVLVLDALDECTGGRAPETILSALAAVIQSVPFLKVFLSSRPTTATNDAFSNEALRQNRDVFILHDVDKDIVDADIQDYMMERLGRKAVLRRLSTSPWPPDDLIKILVKMAGGLFIFASTVCEFIEARGDLEFRLKEITSRPTNEYTGIDGLYREILGYAISQFPDQTTVDHCRSIIGTVILLQDPFSSNDLGQLLLLPPKHIQGILGDLQSVLTVPDDIHGSIHALHASFSDFMSAKARCLPLMYVEPAPHHLMITIRLLEIMREGLKRNMAYLIRFKLNKEEHFSGCLRYACRYWADHLLQADIQNNHNLIQSLNYFLSTNLAYCLEVLDSISNPSENLAHDVIDKAGRWLKTLPKPQQALAQSLNHACTPLEEEPLVLSLFSLFRLSPNSHFSRVSSARMCSEGTRNGVLENVLQWVNDPQGAQVYWLSGAAGTGKTTIAMTIADLVAMDRSKLTATFFCSRYSNYRRKVNHVFVTLSILLAARDTRYRKQLARTVQRHPHVIKAEPKDQLRILIEEPMRLAGLSGKPILFVVDALDECGPLGEDAPGKILEALAKYLQDIPSLKVLISARHSLSISRVLSRPTWNPPPIVFNLHDVDRSLTDQDIRRYLLEVLCTHANIVERLSPNWPPDELLDKLVKKAGGLFTYASFIGQRFVLVGGQKLKDMADYPGSEYEGNLGLDVFYGRMLEWVLECDEEKGKQVREILGLVTHLCEPLTVNNFQELVDIPKKELDYHLLELQSIIIISAEDRVIRTIHDSVQHWLTDPARAFPELLVEATETHKIILSRLVACMVRGLEENSCVSRLAMGESRETLSDLGSGLLDYACRYWAEHLVKTDTTPCLQREVENFLESKLVFWIERLNLSGDLMVAAAALEKARIWYHEVSHPRHECVKAFVDAQQLVMECSIMGVLE